MWYVVEGVSVPRVHRRESPPHRGSIVLVQSVEGFAEDSHPHPRAHTLDGESVRRFVSRQDSTRHDHAVLSTSSYMYRSVPFAFRLSCQPSICKWALQALVEMTISGVLPQAEFASSILSNCAENPYCRAIMFEGQVSTIRYGTAHIPKPGIEPFRC